MSSSGEPPLATTIRRKRLTLYVYVNLLSLADTNVGTAIGRPRITEQRGKGGVGTPSPKEKTFSLSPFPSFTL